MCNVHCMCQCAILVCVCSRAFALCSVMLCALYLLEDLLVFNSSDIGDEVQIRCDF